MSTRYDETWHRLRSWTGSQAQSERLAAQVLLSDGYEKLDPSHPLGGQDGKKDGTCTKNGLDWIMAVYFPREQQRFNKIKAKFLDDLAGVRSNSANGLAFVTNQELRLDEREQLKKLAREVKIDLFHLERVTAILDTPALSSIRKQFLSIDHTEESLRTGLESLKQSIAENQVRLEGLQTGGDTFCYWMLYQFDLEKSIAKNLVIIRVGKYPLYDLRIRIHDLIQRKDIWLKTWGEINSPADFLLLSWPLCDEVYYRISFTARNGHWNQDLILRKSQDSRCWLAATQILGNNGEARFQHIDNNFVKEFGQPLWKE